MWRMTENLVTWCNLVVTTPMRYVAIYNVLNMDFAAKKLQIHKHGSVAHKFKLAAHEIYRISTVSRLAPKISATN